jgi:two-component system, chemotaxis family, response regulator Rcp1
VNSTFHNGRHRSCWFYCSYKVNIFLEDLIQLWYAPRNPFLKSINTSMSRYRHNILIVSTPEEIHFLKEEFEPSLHTVYTTSSLIDFEAFFHRKKQQSKFPVNMIILDTTISKSIALDILRKIKENRELSFIPVIVFVQSEEDLTECYQAHANCCVFKPSDHSAWLEVIGKLKAFWFSAVTLPRN